MKNQTNIQSIHKYTVSSYILHTILHIVPLHFFHTGQLVNLSVHYILHNDPRAEVPEFTFTCRTYGGPATTFIWVLNGEILKSNISQVILDTSQNSVYDNRLRVKSKERGCYNCYIRNIKGQAQQTDKCLTGIYPATSRCTCL